MVGGTMVKGGRVDDEQVDWGRVLLVVFIATQVAVPSIALAFRVMTGWTLNPWGWAMFS